MKSPSHPWRSNWDRIENTVARYHLLTHPFYVAWAEGRLPREALKTYACQYYQHVEAFPTYLSALHARTEDKRTRRVILENLVDEEHKRPTHPELWLRCAEGLGLKREEAEQARNFPEARR